MSAIDLGGTYRDKISGFEGVATARYEYMTGCVRYLLESGGKDGKPEEFVFDEQRLEPVAAPVTPVEIRRTGGRRDIAPRTGSR